MAKPTYSALSSGELLARSRFAPMLVAPVVPVTLDLGSSLVARWARDASASTLLTMASSSVPDTTHPITAAFDGAMSEYSAPALAASIRQYSLMIDLGSALQIDFVMIKLGTALAASTDVEVSCSTVSTFAGADSSVLATWAGPTGSLRLVSEYVGNGTDGYGRFTARYVKLKISHASSDIIPPRIAEFFIGRRYQLSFGPSLPHDPVGLRSEWDDFESSGGYRIRTTRYAGAQSRRGDLVLADFTSAGLLDDRSQITSFLSAIGYGARSFVWCRYSSNATTLRQGTLLCRWMGDLDLSYEGPDDISVGIDLTELPPFALVET